MSELAPHLLAVLKAADCARHLGEHASIAYWTDKHQGSGYHMRVVLAEYEKLAEHIAAIREHLEPPVAAEAPESDHIVIPSFLRRINREPDYHDDHKPLVGGHHERGSVG